LIESFPALFDICQGQDWTFEKVIDSGMDVPFRRRMPPAMAAQWEHIKTCALAHPSSSVADGISWSLNANGRFSTKSMYQHLERSLAGSHNKWIWKAKIPLKIKVFLWQLFQNVIPIRDNLKKGNGLDHLSVPFVLNTNRQDICFSNALMPTLVEKGASVQPH
jgi:hypothetical protein